MFLNKYTPLRLPTDKIIIKEEKSIFWKLQTLSMYKNFD